MRDEPWIERLVIERDSSERSDENGRCFGRTKLALDQVYDFSFVKKADEEIQANNWDPLRYAYVKR
jgi:hypothetical protein